MKTIDISSEAERTYHYASGQTFVIANPLGLTVITDEAGDTHRVTAADGKTYRPERGWTGISWRPAPGEPPFVA